MLTVAKGTLIILMKSFKQMHSRGKHLKDKCLLNTIPKALPQIFCRIIFFFKIIVKSIIDTSSKSGGTPKHEWVKIMLLRVCKGLAICQSSQYCIGCGIKLSMYWQYYGHNHIQVDLDLKLCLSTLQSVRQNYIWPDVYGA